MNTDDLPQRIERFFEMSNDPMNYTKMMQEVSLAKARCEMYTKKCIQAGKPGTLPNALASAIA